MDFRNKLLHASERVDRAVQQRRASAQAIAGRGTNALIALHALLAERSNGSSDYKYHDLTDEVKMAHAVHRQYKPVQLLQSSGSARTQHISQLRANDAHACGLLCLSLRCFRHRFDQVHLVEKREDGSLYGLNDRQRGMPVGFLQELFFKD